LKQLLELVSPLPYGGGGSYSVAPLLDEGGLFQTDGHANCIVGARTPFRSAASRPDLFLAV